MKKILALILALVMVFALVACGTTAAPAATEEPKTEEPAATEAPVEEPTEAPAEPTEAPAEEPATVSADDIEDTMTSADGKYEIAFVTDVGQLKDKSFNQGTFDGVKLYAHENGLSYKYYQPANGDQATDDDRYDAMKAAAENGAKIIVCAGFMQGTALAKAAAEFTDVSFVFVDGWAMTDADSTPSPTLWASRSRKSSAAISPAMLLLRKATRSSASAAAVAAPTRLAAVTATATCRARALPRLSSASRSR